MINKIKINKLDTKEEKKCKKIYNNNYFGQMSKITKIANTIFV